MKKSISSIVALSVLCFGAAAPAAAADSAQSVYDRAVRKQGFTPLPEPQTGIIPGYIYIVMDGKGEEAKRGKGKRGMKFRSKDNAFLKKTCNLFPEAELYSETAVWQDKPEHQKLRNFSFLASLLRAIPGAPSGGLAVNKIKSYSVDWGQPTYWGIPFENEYGKIKGAAQATVKNIAKAKACGELYDSWDKKTKKSSFVILEAVVVDHFDIAFDLNPQANLANDNFREDSTETNETASGDNSAEDQGDTAGGAADGIVPASAEAQQSQTTGSPGIINMAKAGAVLLSNNPGMKDFLKSVTLFSGAKKALASDEGQTGETETAAQPAADSDTASAPGDETGPAKIAKALGADSKCGFSGGIKAALGAYEGEVGFHLCQTRKERISARAPYFVGYKAASIKEARQTGITEHAGPKSIVEGNALDEEAINKLDAIDLSEEFLASLEAFDEGL